MTVASQHVPGTRIDVKSAEPPVTVEVGEKIARRYEVRRKIGTGGWGIVVEAVDTLLGRRVALKILRDRTDATRRRFLREARIAAAVSHPNVLTLHDVGRTDAGDPFLVTELVEGQDLAEQLRFGPTSIHAVIEIARGVLCALEALHERGIVHRDVKPENVLIDASGTVKLVDFGVSTADPRSKSKVARLTDTGVVLGTPLYMSPEQVSGVNIDTRSDLYSLGAMMYELLSGQPPHDAATPAAIFASILRDPIEPVRFFRPDCPPELEAIVQRALSFEPEDRFQTAGEMAAALAALAEETTRSTLESPPPVQLSRPPAGSSFRGSTPRSSTPGSATPRASAPDVGSTCMVRPLAIEEEPRGRKKRRSTRGLKWSLAAMTLCGGLFAGAYDFDHGRFRIDAADSARVLAYFGLNAPADATSTVRVPR
jgi:serine/threonine protein kinase